MENTKARGIVAQDPEVMSGALVFAGTRVPVEVLVEYLAAGDSLGEFLEAIPTVRREQAVAYLEMTPQAVAACAFGEAAGFAPPAR